MGNAASVAERPQRINCEPRSDSIRRPYTQDEHRPASEPAESEVPVPDMRNSVGHEGRCWQNPEGGPHHGILRAGQRTQGGADAMAPEAGGCRLYFRAGFAYHLRVFAPIPARLRGARPP